MKPELELSTVGKQGKNTLAILARDELDGQPQYLLALVRRRGWHTYTYVDLDTDSRFLLKHGTNHLREELLRLHNEVKAAEAKMSAEVRVLGRDFNDDPPWLHAYVYAHDTCDPDRLTKLLVESGFSKEDLARALVHAVTQT